MIDKVLDTKLIRVIAAVIGSVLLLIGALIMAFHKKLNIDYPYWLYAGIFIMIIGLIIWFIQSLFVFILKMKKIKYEIKENEKEKE